MSIDLFQRITTLWGIPSLIFATATGAVGEPQPNQPAMEQVAAIERELGGRIGVAAIDTGNGQCIAYRKAERFPMCSTLKFLAVAAAAQSRANSCGSLFSRINQIDRGRRSCFCGDRKDYRRYALSWWAARHEYC